MKTTLRITALSAFIMFFAHCASNETANSDTVKQSEIYQRYTITYDSGEKELTATASFRFGGANGTTLLLVKPSSILFDNEEMPNEQNVFSGTFYEINKQSDVKSSYTFSFTDCDKKTFTNLAKIFPAEISASPDIADKEIGFSVGWNLPLQNGESITLFVEDKSNNSCSVFNNAVGSNSMKINAAELKNMLPGDVSIYLVRESDNALENATHLGGRLYIKYISKKMGLKLIGPEPKKTSTADSVAG